MMTQIQTLYEKYGQALRYLIVGGLTTVINVVAFYVCNSMLGWAWEPANIVAWLLSVIFALVANKFIVFTSKFTTWRAFISETVAFFALRGASLLADMAIMYVGIDLMNGGTLVVKIVDQVIVIALNYVFSKQIFVSKK